MDFRKGYRVEAIKHRGEQKHWLIAEVLEAHPERGRYLVNFGSKFGKAWRSRGEIRSIQRQAG